MTEVEKRKTDAARQLMEAQEYILLAYHQGELTVTCNVEDGVFREIAELLHRELNKRMAFQSRNDTIIDVNNPN